MTTAALAATVLVGGLTVVAVRRSQDDPAPAPSASASPAPTPSVAALASVGPPVPVGPPPSVTGVRAALAAPLRSPLLGRRVSAVVADATTGDLLYASLPDLPVVPASTAKLLTAVAALHSLDPDERVATVVLARGPIANGTLAGDLVLVGGGDSTLATAAARTGYPPPARIDRLADAAVRAGVRRVTGRVIVDATAFAAPRLGPGWKPTYVSEGSVAPVTALMVDSGKMRPDRTKRSPDPDLAAGRALVLSLKRRGVAAGGVVRGQRTTADIEVGRVESPRIAALVERMVSASDNNLAEALGRLVAIRRQQSPDFAGATAAMRLALEDLGVGTAAAGLHDASGLSRLNRVTARGLVSVLAVALRSGDRKLRLLLPGLPVSGFDGTLASRFDTGSARAGAGRVRAKTGSLDGVSTLAGYVETVSGRVLAFAFAADQLPSRSVAKAADALDAAATALVRCGCS